MEIENKNNFKIEFTKGDTYALKITLKKASDSARLAYFTVKDAENGQIVLQKTLGQGISEETSRAYANEYVYKLQIQAEDTANLESQYQYIYDLQFVIGNVVKTVLSGFFVLGNTVTGVQIITEESVIESVDELEAEIDTVPTTNGIEYETDPIANAKIGDMTELNTTNKETLVDAINEVNTTAETAKTTSQNNSTAITNILNGTTTVPNATNATNSTNSVNANNLVEAIRGMNVFDIFETDGDSTSPRYQNINGVAKKATNADNAVKNANNTYSALTTDVNGVLKFGDNIIPYKKAIINGASFSATPASANQYFDLTLTNIKLEAGKHYRLIGTFGTSSYFKTKLIYECYPQVSDFGYQSILADVLCLLDGSGTIDWHEIAIKPNISGNNTILNIFLAGPDNVNWKVDAFNTLTITDIYEIIE